MSALLDALKNVSQEDLDQVTQQLAEAEAVVDSLKEVKRLLEAKLGFRKPLGWHLKDRNKQKAAERRAAKAEAAASSEEAELHQDEPGGEEDTDEAAEQTVGKGPTQMTATEMHRRKAREFLKTRGYCSLAGIAKQCSIPMGSITNVLKFPWFMATARGWELTQTGKNAD